MKKQNSKMEGNLLDRASLRVERKSAALRSSRQQQQQQQQQYQ